MKNRCFNISVYDLILPVLLGVYVVIMVLVSPVTLVQGSVFCGYQLWSVLLPGTAIYQLLKVPEAGTMERSLCGYSLGYACGILEYLICWGFDLVHLLVPIQIIIGILSIVFLLKCSGRNEDIISNKAEIKHKWLIFTIFLSLVMVIRFIIYYGLNLLPKESMNVTFPTQDILFYIGNAVSAQKGFPLEEFRFAGEAFKYHYFGSLQLGLTSFVTGIPVLMLEICLQWIPSTIMLVGAFWCLMQRMKISKKLCAVGMFILLFTTGKELIVYVAYQHIIYKTPFGFDVGLTFGIIAVILFYIQHKHKKLHLGLLWGSLLAFLACEGSKAPIAVIILFLAGCICGLWLFSAERRKWAFIYGIPYVLLFVAVFFGFISEGLDTITTNTTGLSFSLTGHLYECGLGNIYFDWVEKGMSQILGKILVICMYFFGCNLVTYFLMTVQTGRLLKHGRYKAFSFECCMFAAACAGLIFTLFTKQQGNSQMYFAMTAFPLATIAAIAVWNGIGKINKKIPRWIFYVSFGVVMGISVASYVEIIQPSFASGVDKLSGENTFSQESNSLSFEEWEAYDWIRQNTDEEALCVINLVLNDKQYQSFVAGVCTERRMYMEGWRYVAGYVSQDIINTRRECIRDFFDGKEAAKDEVLNVGVDYAVWVKRFGNGQEAWNNAMGEKVFANEAVEVYRLNGYK